MAITNFNSTLQYGQPVAAKDRTLQSGADLAAKFGNINYDQNAIEGVFQKAVDSEYAAKQAGYNRTANQYYNRLGTSQNAYLDSMKKANAGAVQTGASQGMQSAQALSMMMGQQQITSADNTKLAQDARALVDQQAAAKSAATLQGMQYADQQKAALMGAANTLYSADTQNYIGELGANAQTGAANTAASAAGYAADQGLAGTDLTSARNLEGMNNTAAKNLEGTQYAANQSRAGTQYAADQGLAGQQAYAGGLVQSANANANASRYAANQNVEAQRVASVGQVETAMQQARGDAVQQLLAKAATSADGFVDVDTFLNQFYLTSK